MEITSFKYNQTTLYNHQNIASTVSLDRIKQYFSTDTTITSNDAIYKGWGRKSYSTSSTPLSPSLVFRTFPLFFVTKLIKRSVPNYWSEFVGRRFAEANLRQRIGSVFTVNEPAVLSLNTDIMLKTVLPEWRKNTSLNYCLCCCWHWCWKDGIKKMIMSSITINDREINYVHHSTYRYRCPRLMANKNKWQDMIEYQELSTEYGIEQSYTFLQNWYMKERSRTLPYFIPR